VKAGGATGDHFWGSTRSGPISGAPIVMIPFAPIQPESSGSPITIPLADVLEFNGFFPWEHDHDHIWSTTPPNKQVWITYAHTYTLRRSSYQYIALSIRALKGPVIGPRLFEAFIAPCEPFHRESHTTRQATPSPKQHLHDCEVSPAEVLRRNHPGGSFWPR
jgi:hypothetical protein